MIIANLIIGAFLILMGFVVKAFPDAIAGYNTMSAEKKKNVDVDGLSSMMKICMIVMGALVAGGMPFFKLFNWNINPVLFMLSVILPFTIGMVILAQRYDHNKHPWYTHAFTVVVLVGIVAFVGMDMFKNREPLEVSIIDNQITISGSYGLTTSINKIELIETIPRIKLRTGGLDDGLVRKGKFLLEEWGTCKLFLQSQGGPYIKVSTSGQLILINGASSEDTRRLYEELLNQK